jgi:CxxC motif-containing protein (DUF1111 family)
MFLESLGGRSQYSTGLLPPNLPIPAVGEYGGPSRLLTSDEAARFAAGRELFDRDFSLAEGVGTPVFNGDSCRACHFDPVIAGAGPAGVNVMRHGSIDTDGGFVAPEGGTILHKQTARLDAVVAAPTGTAVFEQRQTPALFGLGLVDTIDETVIIANADPDDADGDGISGRPAVLPDGRLGRFGWKAQVPSLSEFLRDAAAAELGLTMGSRAGHTFGITVDTDAAPDPELTASEAELIEFFLAMLGPPPRAASATSDSAIEGAAVFAAIGCSTCHVPALDGPDGPVPLFSDLLLHEILPDGTAGIVDGPAGQTELRTPPLWGLRDTAPYLHDGSAPTIDDAVRAHAGEAAAVRDSYLGLTDADRAALQAFLESL